MTWHQPHLLWLLLALPLCVGVIALSAVLRRRANARFGSEAAKMIVGRSSGLRATRAVLLVLGLALAIVALARPQYGSRTKLLSKRGVDVVIALDFSKSMLAQDIRPSRIERAKAEIARFISELAGDRIGVVAFAGETMEFPMTVDYSAAALFFRELTPADMPVGGTAIGRALTASKQLLERSNKNEADLPPAQRRAKVVVLMTDGEDHEGDPAAAAEELAKMGAKVFVIALGSKSGEPIPTYAEDGTWTGYMRGDDGQPILSVLTPEAEQQLKAVAEKTGGLYFAPGRGSVGVDQIRKELRGMKQVELQARRVTVHEERYALVLLIAFLLIVLEALLPEAWFRKTAVAVTALGLVALGSLASPSDAHAQAPSQAPAWLRSKNSDVEQGNERLAAGDAEGALKAYDEAARALPSEGGVHLNRGLALLKAGKLDAARDALKLSTDSSAGSPEIRSDAYYDLGVAYYRQAEAKIAEQNDEEAQKAFREASDSFRKSLRQKPGSPNAAYNYELTQRRIVELEKKQQEKQDQQKQDEQNKDQEQQDQQNQDQQSQNQDPQNQDQQDPKDQQQQPGDQGKKDEPKPDQKDAQNAPKPDPKKQEQQQQQQQQEQQAQQGKQDKELPPDMAKALDALQQGEKNLEQQRAMQRAGSGHRRPPEKDW